MFVETNNDEYSSEIITYIQRELITFNNLFNFNEKYELKSIIDKFSKVIDEKKDTNLYGDIKNIFSIMSDKEKIDFMAFILKEEKKIYYLKSMLKLVIH